MINFLRVVRRNLTLPSFHYCVEGWSGVFFYAIIAAALTKSLGNYRMEWVVLFTMALCCFTFLFFCKTKSLLCRFTRQVDVVVLFVLIFSLWRLWDRSQLLYVQNLYLVKIQQRLLLLAAVTGTLTFFICEKKRGFWILAALSVISLVGAKILTPLVSPSPHIDVFLFGQLALDSLFQGVSPYSQSFPDSYSAVYGYAPKFCYPPLILYLTAPFKLFFSDHRFVYVVADMIAATSLFVLARRAGGNYSRSIFVSLLWLSFPVSLFIIEQAWVDSILIAEMGLLALAISGRGHVSIGILLGLVIATKQYGVIAVIPIVVWCLSHGFSKKQIGKIGVLAVGTVLVSIIPFLVWDFSGFYQNVVLDLIGHSLRTDAFSLLSLLQQEFGIVLSSGRSLILTLVVLLLSTGVVLKRQGKQSWATGLAIIYGFVFLFAKQAFCNYYQIVAYLLLVAVSQDRGKISNLAGGAHN